VFSLPVDAAPVAPQRISAMRPPQPAAQRLENVYLIPRLEARVEPLHLGAVDEEADVGSQPVLLVDDPEAQAGEAAVEVLEHLGQGLSLGVHLAQRPGVGGEERGQVHPHPPHSATSTDWISGRCWAMHAKRSPSSALAQSSPLVVPK